MLSRRVASASRLAASSMSASRPAASSVSAHFPVAARALRSPTCSRERVVSVFPNRALAESRLQLDAAPFPSRALSAAFSHDVGLRARLFSTAATSTSDAPRPFPLVQADRVAEMDASVHSLEARVKTMQADVDDLAAQIRDLAAQIRDLAALCAERPLKSKKPFGAMKVKSAFERLDEARPARKILALYVGQSISVTDALKEAKAELDKAEGKLDKAKAELKEAEGRLDKAKAELDKAKANPAVPTLASNAASDVWAFIQAVSAGKVSTTQPSEEFRGDGPLDRESSFEEFLGAIEGRPLPVATPSQDRMYYPLIAVAATPGSGKTHFTQAIAQNWTPSGVHEQHAEALELLKESHKVFVTFNSGSPISSEDYLLLKENAVEAVLAHRILYSYFGLDAWSLFSAACYRSQAGRNLKVFDAVKAIKYHVTQVLKREWRGLFIFIDELAKSGTVEQAQRILSGACATMHHFGDRELWVVATGLNSITYSRELTRSRRPILSVNLPPLTFESSKQLLDKTLAQSAQAKNLQADYLPVIKRAVDFVHRRLSGHPRSIWALAQGILALSSSNRMDGPQLVKFFRGKVIGTIGFSSVPLSAELIAAAVLSKEVKTTDTVLLPGSKEPVSYDDLMADGALCASLEVRLSTLFVPTIPWACIAPKQGIRQDHFYDSVSKIALFDNFNDSEDNRTPMWSLFEDFHLHFEAVYRTCLASSSAGKELGLIDLYGKGLYAKSTEARLRKALFTLSKPCRVREIEGKVPKLADVVEENLGDILVSRQGNNAGCEAAIFDSAVDPSSIPPAEIATSLAITGFEMKHTQQQDVAVNEGALNEKARLFKEKCGRISTTATSLLVFVDLKVKKRAEIPDGVVLFDRKLLFDRYGPSFRDIPIVDVFEEK